MTGDIHFSLFGERPGCIPAEGQTETITAANIADMTPLVTALTGSAPQIGDEVTIPNKQDDFPGVVVFVEL